MIRTGNVAHGWHLPALCFHLHITYVSSLSAYVVTPDYLYKIIVKANGSYNAWIMPNNSAPREENGANYLVSIKDIERATNASFPIKGKDKKPTKMFSWPGKCDFS